MLGLAQLLIMRLINEAPGLAYGASIAEQANLVDAQVYMALSRMEKRNLLTSRLEERKGTGRPRRYYSLTKRGRDQLKKANQRIGA